MDNNRNQSQWAGPFGMGGQGWLIVAVIIIGTAVFAATRSNWTSAVVSAIVLPLIMFVLIFLLSRLFQPHANVRNQSGGSGEGVDLMTFLARTNPIMFLLVGTVSRRSNDEQYRQLLRSGPFGMGQLGYLIALLLILAPLILTFIIIAVSGQQPGHIGQHFP